MVYEFYVLLLQGNLQGLAMFEEIQGCIPEKEEIAQGVLSLVDKNFLQISDDNAYSLTQEAKTILDILERAKSTFVINGQLSGCPMQCLYFSANLCLTLQMDDFRDGYVRIEVQDKTDAVNGLMDYEFMPDMDRIRKNAGDSPFFDHMEMDGDKPQGADAIVMKKFEPDMDIENMLSEEEVMLIVDRYPRYADFPAKRAVIYSAEERYLLSVCENGESETEIFCMEAFSNLFVEA